LKGIWLGFPGLERSRVQGFQVLKGIGYGFQVLKESGLGLYALKGMWFRDFQVLKRIGLGVPGID
jgi:hypothetical protein